jgi:hypothetical protein
MTEHSSTLCRVDQGVPSSRYPLRQSRKWYLESGRAGVDPVPRRLLDPLDTAEGRVSGCMAAVLGLVAEQEVS